MESGDDLMDGMGRVGADGMGAMDFDFKTASHAGAQPPRFKCDVERGKQTPRAK